MQPSQQSRSLHHTRYMKHGKNTGLFDGRSPTVKKQAGTSVWYEVLCAHHRERKFSVRCDMGKKIMRCLGRCKLQEFFSINNFTGLGPMASSAPIYFSQSIFILVSFFFLLVKSNTKYETLKFSRQWQCLYWSSGLYHRADILLTSPHSVTALRLTSITIQKYFILWSSPILFTFSDHLLLWSEISLDYFILQHLPTHRWSEKMHFSSSSRSVVLLPSILLIKFSCFAYITFLDRLFFGLLVSAHFKNQPTGFLNFCYSEWDSSP
jgi:hypothetical protein